MTRAVLLAAAAGLCAAGGLAELATLPRRRRARGGMRGPRARSSAARPPGATAPAGWRPASTPPGSAPAWGR